ncbi:hypothetical protein FQA39_LY00811 [Lamprigera yunnana]|nr:hypothetical protein FQA39_LY00811 [Lamprigera yunnana]
MGNDRKGTLALISSLSERFSRTLVFAGGCVLLSHIRSGIEAMLQCHNENLGIEFHKTESEVSSSYELYGSHLTECDVNENTLTAGAFLLNCSWNVCQFDIPEQDCKIKMLLQVIVGHVNSGVYSLYEDFEILQKCVTDLFNGSYVENSKISCTPLEDKELHQDIINIMNTIHFIKLRVADENNFECINRQSFTNKLWNLFKRCKDINSLQNGFCTLFSTMDNRSLKIQMLEEDRNSKIGQIVEEIYSNRMIIPHLSTKQCLELFIDLGIQVLKKRYLDIIKYYDLKIASDFLNKWSSVVLPTKSSSRLTIMDLNVSYAMTQMQFLFQTHIVIEFLKLAENVSCISVDIKRSILTHLFYKYLVNPIQDTLLKRKIRRFYEIEVPLSTSNFGELLLQDTLTQWKLKLSSYLKNSSVITVFYYSKKSIFSTSISNLNHSQTSDNQGQQLYGVRLETYCDEI